MQAIVLDTYGSDTSFGIEWRPYGFRVAISGETESDFEVFITLRVSTGRVECYFAEVAAQAVLDSLEASEPELLAPATTFGDWVDEFFMPTLD